MSTVLLKLKCCICGNVGNSNLRLFKVPKSEDRLKKWLQIFNREDLLELDYGYLQICAKVCSKHFHDWCYTGTDKKRLIAFAMPETVEPPSAPLPQSLKTTATTPSISSQVKVTRFPDTSLPKVSNTPRLQFAATASAIGSGQVISTKFIAPSDNPQPQVAVPAVVSTPFKRSREAQIILNQRSTISKLRKRIEKLKVSFSEQLKNKLTPDMYEFVMSQIRQGGRSIKGRRWKKEDKAFASAVYKKSPGVYKLLREKLALPSKATLRRYS